MKICTLRACMLIALYLSVIFIILAALDDKFQEFINSLEPIAKPLVKIGAVISVIIIIIGIHGVYSEKRGLFVPFIFFNCLVTPISLCLVGDLYVREFPVIYVTRLLTFTIVTFLNALMSYIYFHEVDKRPSGLTN